MRKDWKLIKHDYITSDTSIRELAVRYDVSRSTLQDRRKREGWRAEKADYQTVLKAKTVQLFREKARKQEVAKLDLFDGMVYRTLLKLSEAVDSCPDEAKDLQRLVGALKDMAGIIGYIQTADDGGPEAGVILMPEIMDEVEIDPYETTEGEEG